MKATWEASVPTHLVPDTEAKRIREYKAITQVSALALDIVMLWGPRVITH